MIRLRFPTAYRRPALIGAAVLAAAPLLWKGGAWLLDRTLGDY